MDPVGVTVDSLGYIYIIDIYAHTLRVQSPAGAVTTLAGRYYTPGLADGSGTNAKFYSPYNVAVDSARNLYVADCDNHKIRKVTTTGATSFYADQ